MLSLFFLSSKFMWKNFLGVSLKYSKLIVVASSSNLSLTCLLRVLRIAYPVHTQCPKWHRSKKAPPPCRDRPLFWPDQMFHSITGLMLFKPPYFSSIECPPPSSIFYLPARFYFIKHQTIFPYEFLIVLSTLICVHTKLISLIFGPLNVSS